MLPNIIRDKAAAFFKRVKELGITTSLDTAFDHRKNWMDGLNRIRIHFIHFNKQNTFSMLKTAMPFKIKIPLLKNTNPISDHSMQIIDLRNIQTSPNQVCPCT